MKQNENPKRSGHLDYLLTAYVFDSLSVAGQKEVDEHLAACAACRAQLDLLRQTLGLAEEALDAGGTEYVFEDRRRERVLEAARRRSTMPRLQWNWKLPLVAALLMVTTLVGILASLTQNRSAPMANAKSAPASKEYGYSNNYDANQPSDSYQRGSRVEESKNIDESRYVQSLGTVEKKETPLAPAAGAAPSAPPPSVSFGLGAQPSKPGTIEKETVADVQQLEVFNRDELPAPKAALADNPKPAESAPTPVPESPKPEPAAGGKPALDDLAAAPATTPRFEYAVKLPPPLTVTVTGVPTTSNTVTKSDPAWMNDPLHHASDIPPSSSTPAVPSQRHWAAKTPPEEPVVAAKAALTKPEPELPGLATLPEPTVPAERKLKYNEARDHELQEQTKLAAVKDDPNGDQDKSESRALGRGALAIASKDAAIRKQEELVRQEREGRAALQQANEGLAKQNEELADRNAKIAADDSEMLKVLNARMIKRRITDGQFVGDNGKKSEAATQTPPPVASYFSAFDGDVDTTTAKGVGRESAKLPQKTPAHNEDAGVEFQGLDPNTLMGDFGDIRRLGAPTGIVQPRVPGASPKNAPLPDATQPESKEVADIVVPQDVLEKAELGDHFETINPDSQPAGGTIARGKAWTRDKVIIRQKEETPAGAQEAASGKRGEYGITLGFDEKSQDPQQQRPEELKQRVAKGKELAEIQALHGEIKDKITEALADEEKPVTKLGKEVTNKYGPTSQRGASVAGDDEAVALIDQSKAHGTTSASPKAGYVFTGENPKPITVPGAGGNLYLNYPKDSVGQTDGVLPGSSDFPAPITEAPISGAGGGGVGGKSLDDMIGVGGVASPGTGGGFGSQNKKKPDGNRYVLNISPDANKININSGDNLAVYLDDLVRVIDAPIVSQNGKEDNGEFAYSEKEKSEKGLPASDGKPKLRAYGNMQYAGVQSALQARANLNAIEGLLRAYRHLRAENPQLTWNEFLRRPAPVPAVAKTDEGLDEDAYIEKFGTRPFVDCARDHLSTFGLDVDTASYALTRSRLRQNELPDPDAVRVEEFLNYFKQPYTVAGDDAFGVFAEGAPSPFAGPQGALTGGQATSGTFKALAAPTELLKIGIKSREARADERKPAMLTFVVDTSGSMTRQDRLDLVRAALKTLVEKLNPEDAVSIIGFNDQAELSLPRTQAKQKQRIIDAIDALTSKGGTNVEAGLTMAYRLADESFSPDAVNRVILCSDGVANIGAKGPDEILKLVKVFAGRGIDLCTIGFGMGKYNDQMMVKLADSGNGSCHFVDSRAEAEKIFSEQLPPHLNVLARDAKAQIDFNPDVVERYRLLGYEKRKIADKDFRNDKIDAGEVAHNTLITVLYEIQRKPTAHGPLGKVYLRWKDAGYRHLPVVERNYPLSEGVVADAQHASPELRFLACVARFAELLRGSKWVQDSSYAAVLAELQRLPPEFKARPDWAEVRELVARAQELSVKQWAAELRK